MSRLLEVQEQILSTSAEIARLEKALALRPSRALNSSLKSLYKLQSQLQAAFQEAAAIDQVDVVAYRIFDGRHPTMSLVGKAMDSFQTLYAVLYSAIVSERPKDTAHLSAAVVQQSAFDFAYAFSGSVGFVFTIPNERLLFGETRLDEAMDNLFAIARCSTTDEVRDFAKRFGLAPVRAVYDWVKTLSISGSGADLQWRKNDSAKASLILQPAEVEALRNLINLTSDLEIDQNEIRGTLIGYDLKANSFRLEPLDGSAIIRGSVSGEAELPSKVTIPKVYTAIVKTTQRVYYATEQPDTNHELLSLK